MFENETTKEAALSKLRIGQAANKQRRKDAIANYNEQPKLCKFCNGPIAYDKRYNDFCNHSCAASFNNIGVTRNPRNAPLRNCLNCNINLHRSRRKFCGHVCEREYKRKQLLDLWLSGKYPKIIKGAPLVARAYILEKQHGACAICGNIEWCGQKIPLILDHIDGNSDDSTSSNVRLICGNCDMQLPTYKSRNRGSGRHYRRERYKQGKSY